MDSQEREFWSQAPAIAAVSQPVLLAVYERSRRYSYRGGETIFLEGAPVAGWFVVSSGCVKICRFSKEGREHIIHLLRQGNTFNDVAVLDGGPNPATAIAYTETTVLQISRGDLQALAKEFPELAWALAVSIAERARFLVAQVQDLSMRQVRDRLARLLLEGAAVSGGDAVDRLLTQEDMAARLGTVREMVGRSLRALADDGVLQFDRHRIVILDVERLRAEAGI